ncbi:MAG: hypothetical protein WAX85_00800 [Minisyncoccia bacterium]
MQTPVARFFLFVAVFIVVVVLPWWLTIPILIGLTIYYPLYLEVLFFGFLIDTLYSSNYSFPYLGLFMAFSFLLLVYFIKTHIRT